MPMVDQRSSRHRIRSDGETASQAYSSHKDASGDMDQSVDSRTSSTSKKKLLKKKQPKKVSSSTKNSSDDQNQLELELAIPKPDMASSSSQHSRRSMDDSNMTGRDSNDSGSTEQPDVWLDVPKLT